MNSGLYIGDVRHRRLQPRPHAFRYRLFMVYLDLGELERVFKGRWLWSTRGPALAWFRRADHFGDPEQPLDACVRDRVQQETGRRPEGPIRLLTHLRYFGYCFNPISVYYCFDAGGERVETVVAEVTNTPWGERCCYVLDTTEPPPYRFAKRMHVSPFMPLDLGYVWRSTAPGERLGIRMDVCAGPHPLFNATLSLRRRPISTAALAGTLLRFPFMTLKVIAAIHWEALRLWWKGIPYVPHPPDRLTLESRPHE